MIGAALAAGALFVDGEGRVLLVEPVYKPEWDIPGGMVEPGESPRAACVRELAEELGLDLEPGRLLVADWAPKGGHDRVLFVFDGGTLTAEQLAAIVLQAEELASWTFVAPSELGERLDPRLRRRLESAIAAKAASATWYLEHGVRVG